MPSTTTSTAGIRNLTSTVAQLVKSLNLRNRDIISRRFGLKNGTKETLESIGRGYGITRERVRQIEEFSLAHLIRVASEHMELVKATNSVQDLIAGEGCVLREHSLFKLVSGTDRHTPSNAALVFALTLDKRLERTSDNDRFHAFWSLDRSYADAFRSQISALVSALVAHGRAMPADQFCSWATENGVVGADGKPFSSSHLAVAMSICKDLGSNVFDQIGLVSWPHVRPKGVRDKAYLVVARTGEAQHFSQIAKLINRAGFNSKKVNVQTVHNELIKDVRFVLVGRGMYALAEWGYKAGTVRDVITDIMKAHGKPLPRAELIAKVKEVRMVKENTILLNLQDSSAFARDANGHYVIRKRS